MKKAIISTGGKQYLVKEGNIIDIELLKSDKNTVSFEAMLIIDGDSTKIGKPTIEGAKVTASILEPVVQAKKVTSIRYKAKKRVKTVKGHRQKLTRVKIDKIA